MKIGIFDSGKGGITVFDEIRKILLNEEYRYIADSENCPYGEKSDEELTEIVRNNVEELKAWGTDIIVIACNTATTRCIENLRREYPYLEFVGTEPAIRLAAKTDAKRVLVMATPSTIESERTQSLLEENWHSDQEFLLLACPGLADAIEKGHKVTKMLKELFMEFHDIDCVVLGCTHYSLIKDEIQQFFPNAKIIDGNKGVAERVKAIVESKKPLN